MLTSLILIENPLYYYTHLVITLLREIIQSNCMFRISKLQPIPDRNKICSTCENGKFKVKYIAYEETLLICETCGEIQRIGPYRFAEDALHNILYFRQKNDKRHDSSLTDVLLNLY